jgi:formate-dependent nitrite reductase membrane component NrfD
MALPTALMSAQKSLRHKSDDGYFWRGARLFSPVIFLFEGLWTGSRAAALLSQIIRTKAGEEPMLDAVMIAFLFLDALCVVIVLADEIRTSLSRLRARGR